MIKKLSTYILLLITVISICRPVYAENLNADEEMNTDELTEYMNTALTDIEEMPKINARHAVVIERETRKNTIWKKRRRKMQDGQYDKNHDLSCRA